MLSKYRIHLAFAALFLFIALPGILAQNSWADEDSKYLNAVREFADNVLKCGRDTYGPKHTPLFVDGLNIHTHEPVKWIAPNGDRWILSNLASQQNLFRTLDGLTKITGDPKYRRAAMEAIKYAFENLRSPNGLFYWGVGYAYDADGDRERSDTRNHSLRFVYPYYELMWEVTQDGLKDYVESLWAAHVLDWSNLDVLRYAPLDKYKVAKGWNDEYKGGPVSNVGKGDCVTGSDLYYAAAVLSKLSGKKEPLVWAKRMAYRYVETRDPNTGIASRSYNINTIDKHSQFAEDFEGRKLSFFPNNPQLFVEPVAKAEGDEVGFWAYAQIRAWICTCLLGDFLGSDGEDFKRWALEELTAWGKWAYRERDNTFIPMFTDGTSLEGYVVKKDGPYGAKGTVFKAWHPHGLEFWAYALAHRMTGDQFVWDIARSIANGNDLGDIGSAVEVEPELSKDTDCSDPYALLGFLELYRKTGGSAFLEMASRIGDNILSYRFHNGFFVPSKRHIYSRFDDLEHLVLLHLFAAIDSKSVSVPWVWPGKSGFGWDYRQQRWVFDVNLIYTLTDSPEPPMSLHEAAAIGDLKRAKLLLQQGADVNSRERDMATPLLRAMLGQQRDKQRREGNEEMIAFLLSKGADVEVRDSFPGGTSLYYAVENGLKEVVELLIAKGADVNAKKTYNPAGDTPLHAATRAGHMEIAELLIHGGANVNAKNNEDRTPIEVVRRRNRKEIVDLLKKHGATEEPAQSMRRRWQSMSAEERGKLREQIRKRLEANKKQEVKE